ncbi:hypothetical protein N7931_07760 [Catenovulum sp. 2E275]|uniref:hypothetical protein n=1 Tax=Catenovulum sp. 2E275 TaxID=2980497 RepID=UPI0021CEE33A|nr:hypothetical protein [Catenovulum sp. 2E275]MCU4675530.1 hypothetical protein [Catenovulum sp. 2E275]
MAMRMLTPQIRKTKFVLRPCSSSIKLVTSFGLLAMVTDIAAGELTFKPELSLDYYKVEVQSGSLSSSNTSAESQNVDDQVVKVTPSLALIYESKKLNLSGFTEYVQTKHDNESEPDREFFSYGLDTQLDLIQDTLTWTTSFGKSYKVMDSRLGIFSDEVVGSENLTGVTNYQTGLLYQLRNQRFLHLKAGALISRSQAEAEGETDLSGSNFSSGKFDTQSKEASVSVGSGISSRFSWNINLMTSYSDRANQQDYTQSRFSTLLDIPVSDRLGWVVKTQIDKNKIDNETALSDGLTYKEYGTGLRWSFTRQSYINILAYRSKTGEQETRSFIGGDLSWLPSDRSSLQFSANRNQFGENYSLNLQQNSRFLKTRAKFAQGVDINSRRQFVSGEVGSFICPIGTLDFTECFQPTDPNYQVSPGEEEIGIIGQDIELNDEVVKFSSGSFSIGYDNSRKLKFNLTYKYSKQEGLENTSLGNDRESQSVTWSAAYAMSTKTQLVFNTTFGESRYLNETTNASLNREDKNTSMSVFLNTKLSTHLSGQVGVSKRERNSNSAGLDTEDKRFNAQLAYRF